MVCSCPKLFCLFVTAAAVVDVVVAVVGAVAAAVGAAAGGKVKNSTTVIFFALKVEKDDHGAFL